MKNLFIGLGLICAVLAIYVVINIMGGVTDTVDVARQEFGPKAAMVKYEWFKSAANELKAKNINIESYRVVLLSMDNEYGPKTNWSRDVRQEYAQRKSELAGMIAAYNELVASYETASSKFNWSPFQGREDFPPTKFVKYSN